MYAIDATALLGKVQTLRALDGWEVIHKHDVMIAPILDVVPTAELTAAHARIAELEAEIQGLRANSMIQEQIIKDGGNPFDKGKIVRLIMEKAALQSNNKEAMELLAEAMHDLSVSYGAETCEFCENQAHCNDREQSYCQGVNFKWVHADHYKALTAQSNEMNGGDKL